ncbi:hypothetical protein [Micromonospora sp. IBSANI012]|uniref:hypothetical protein n=1 Tax=Micromonospora sp. IBSANI012 TaxID=3457761 RepID=UPI00405A4984
MIKGRKQPVRPRPETGDALRARLGAGPVTLSWTGIANSPYVYNLALTSDHKVPNVLAFDAADSDVAALDEQWYAQRTAGTFGDLMTAGGPYGTRVFLGNRQAHQQHLQQAGHARPMATTAGCSRCSRT